MVHKLTDIIAQIRI